MPMRNLLRGSGVSHRFQGKLTYQTLERAGKFKSTLKRLALPRVLWGPSSALITTINSMDLQSLTENVYWVFTVSEIF